MKRIEFKLACVAMLIAFCAALPARADELAKKIRDDVKPSLVAVKYSFATELGTTTLSAAGIVIGNDGLIVFPALIVSPNDVSEEQITKFEIIIPQDDGDDVELDATYLGRDERTDLAFAKPTGTTNQTWKPVKFVDVKPEIGDTVYSVGMLPKYSGYRTNITSSMISTPLRGPVPQYLVDGGLAGAGSVIFDAKEEAIGMEQPHSVLDAMLESPQRREEMPPAVANPWRYFIPAGDFLDDINNPPSPDHPYVIPWIGLPQPKGVEPSMAEFLGLKGQTLVEVGDVVKGSPAAKAGLQTSDVIVKMNGQPLERGDLPEELPGIMTRKIQRMKVGDTVTFSVIRQKGDTPHDVSITLEPRPKSPSQAHRYYARDIGLVARDVVFVDTYYRKLPENTGGIAIALLQPQSPSAAAKLGIGDMITQMNGQPVTDLDGFKKAYEDARKNNPSTPIVLEVLHVDGKQATINVEPPQKTIGAETGN